MTDTAAPALPPDRTTHYALDGLVTLLALSRVPCDLVDLGSGEDVAQAATRIYAALRRADRDVIDWLRETPAERWQTYNIRAIDTVGVEAGVRRRFGKGVFFLADYTWLDLDADDVTQLSKYALDYAPHSLVTAGSVSLPWRLRVAPRVELKRRTRSTGNENYVLLDVRAGVRLSTLLDVYVDGLNRLDQSYSEVAGVPMPGAAMMVSLAVGR